MDTARLTELATELEKAGFFRHLPESYAPNARKLIINGGLVYVWQHRFSLSWNSPEDAVDVIQRYLAKMEITLGRSLAFERQRTHDLVKLGDVVLWNVERSRPSRREEWEFHFPARLASELNDELARAGSDERFFPRFPGTSTFVPMTERAYELLHENPDVDQLLLPLRVDAGTASAGLKAIAIAVAHPMAYAEHRVFWMPSEVPVTSEEIPARVVSTLLGKGLSAVRTYVNRSGQALLLCHHKNADDGKVNYFVIVGERPCEDYPSIDRFGAGNHGLSNELAASGRLLGRRYLVFGLEGLMLFDLETMKTEPVRMPNAEGVIAFDVDPAGERLYTFYYAFGDPDFPGVEALELASGEVIQFKGDELMNSGIAEAAFCFDGGVVRLDAKDQDGSDAGVLLLDPKSGAMRYA